MAPVVDVRFHYPGIPREARGRLEAFSRALLGRCMADLGYGEGELSLLYCSVAEMKRINSEFRQIEKETDVLSFPATDDPSELKRKPQPFLGDIAVCLKVCAQQAPANNRGFLDEVALLLVHGLLHLLGYDHDTPAREKKMWAETDRLLALCAKIKHPRLALK